MCHWRSPRAAGHGKRHIGTVGGDDVPELVFHVDCDRRAVGDSGGDIAGLDTVRDFRRCGGMIVKGDDVAPVSEPSAALSV